MLHVRHCIGCQKHIKAVCSKVDLFNVPAEKVHIEHALL